MTSYDITTNQTRCTITIDEDLCTGTGLCMVYGPETFDMNDAMKGIVKAGPYDELSVILSAAESCPNRAVAVTEH
jgi:ferredoxin